MSFWSNFFDLRKLLVLKVLIYLTNEPTTSATPSTTRSKRAPSHHGFVVSMLSAAIPPARSAASPANSVKRYVQLLPLQLKRRSGKMAVGERQDTT